MNFVLDASVTMSWLLRDGQAGERDYANHVLETVKRADAQARVPVIWGLEVANVITKAESRAHLTEAQSEAFLELLANLDIVVDTSTVDSALRETLSLARRYMLSAYDASYLELALREGLPLATLDRDLAAAASKAGVARM